MEKTKLVQLTKTQASNIPKLMQMERLEDTRDFILPYTESEHQEVIDNPDKAHLTILNSKGKIIGFILLFEMANRNQRILLQRIVIGEKNKGYGRAALYALKKMAFETLKVNRLWLDVFDDNERARYLYRSEGFVEEGLLRECIKTEQGFRNLIVMGLLATDFYKTRV